MSSPKTYTAHDIERYHKGEMTSAEMHLLEKTALDDPMLADALEGYTYTPTAADDLQSLQKKLQQRLDENKKGTIFHTGNRWMKIAALFLLIAGGGWLVLQTLTKKENDLAKSTDANTERPERSTLADSVSTVQNTSLSTIPDSLQRNNEIIAAGTKRKQEVPSPAGVASSAPLSTMSKAPVKGEREKDITETKDVTDNATTSEIASLKSNEPANTRREALDTGKHLDAGQQQSNASLDETAPNRRMQSSQARVAIAETSEPEGGWQAFEKYIAENQRFSDDAKRKSTTGGEVELSFEISKNGRPTNIVVLKSPCKKCDAEAIRLLKEGPKWKGKSARVKILLFL